MTLNLKDINSAATGSFTHRHFSKISILHDSLSREEQKRHKVFLEEKVSTVYDISRKCYHDHSGKDRDAEVVSEENKEIANLLSTESDSVLDYSIIGSDRDRVDSDLQMFTPNVVGADYFFDLAELNAQMALLLVEYFPRVSPNADYLKRITLAIIPQVVQLNQALDRYDHLGSPKNSVDSFLKTCNKTFLELWVPHLTESIRIMKSALQCLEGYEGKFNRTEAKGTIDSDTRKIIRRWSLLNYFPMVLIKSLSFNIECSYDHSINSNDRYMIYTSELYKIAFITLAIEVSKGLEKVIHILIELKASDALHNRTMIRILELLLECTVDSRAAEIMIGLDQTIKKWIIFKETTDKSTRNIFHHWAEQVLESYNTQRALEYKLKNTEEEEEEEEADLMFDKWEVGKMFINEIIQFIEPKDSTRTKSSLFGWFTVFDEFQNFTTSQEAQFDFDTITIQSIPLPITTGSLTHTLGKREAIRRWASNKRNKVSEGCRKIKQKIQETFHMHTNSALITSVRYYNALNGQKYEYHFFPDETTDFTPDQCAQVQRVTEKLYKREKRGKRKRDAIRVIFM